MCQTTRIFSFIPRNKSMQDTILAVLRFGWKHSATDLAGLNKIVHMDRVCWLE